MRSPRVIEGANSCGKLLLKRVMGKRSFTGDPATGIVGDDVARTRCIVPLRYDNF